MSKKIGFLYNIPWIKILYKSAPSKDENEGK